MKDLNDEYNCKFLLKTIHRKGFAIMIDLVLVNVPYYMTTA